MEIEAEIVEYIGEKNEFSIRYSPIKNDSNFAFCHLVLGGQIIGDKNEACYLSTWLSSIKSIKDKITHNSKPLFHEEFSNRNDRELFELIWKANQLEEDYKIEYNYLPILGSEIWNCCHISIDETTDAYLIAMIEINDKIKFLWEGWREPCSDDEIGKLYSILVDKNFVLETIEKMLVKCNDQ